MQSARTHARTHTNIHTHTHTHTQPPAFECDRKAVFRCGICKRRMKQEKLKSRLCSNSSTTYDYAMLSICNDYTMLFSKLILFFPPSAHVFCISCCHKELHFHAQIPPSKPHKKKKTVLFNLDETNSSLANPHTLLLPAVFAHVVFFFPLA